MLFCVICLHIGEACCQDLHLEALDVAIQPEVAGHAPGGLPAVVLQPGLHAAGGLPHIAPAFGGDQAVDQVLGCSRSKLLRDSKECALGGQAEGLPHHLCSLPSCGAFVCKVWGVAGLDPLLPCQGAAWGGSHRLSYCCSTKNGSTVNANHGGGVCGRVVAGPRNCSCRSSPGRSPGLTTGQGLPLVYRCSTPGSCSWTQRQLRGGRYASILGRPSALSRKGGATAAQMPPTLMKWFHLLSNCNASQQPACRIARQLIFCSCKWAAAPGTRSHKEQSTASESSHITTRNNNS